MANELKDYEQGTWTPISEGFDVKSGPVTFPGTYTKIGKPVKVKITLKVK
jgi:hypothetical protein